jgi:uncharacterized protein YndB with AHSA1/START domain
MSEQVTANGRFVDKHTIEFDLHYDHPRSLVWKAITDPESLAVWMMPMELDLRVGGQVSLDPGRGRAVGVITALEPEALLEYRFDDGQAFWPESVLRWELSDDVDVAGEHGAGCRLRFTQRLGAGVDFSPGQIAGPGTFHPGTCAGWEGFFAEGLTRFLAGRAAPIYDEADDPTMAARTPIYRRRLVESFGDASVDANRGELLDRETMRHTRWYAHPIERVWAAITDGEQAAVWHGWPVTIDLRVGGHAVFGPPDEPHWESDVVALEPPRVIEFSHPEAAPNGGAIRYELTEEDGGTRLTFTQWFLPSDESPWRADFVGGFHGMFDLLGWMLDGEPVERDPWRWRDVLVPAYEEFLREA